MEEEPQPAARSKQPVRKRARDDHEDEEEDEDLDEEEPAVKRRQLDRSSEWVQSLTSNFRRFPYGE